MKPPRTPAVRALTSGPVLFASPCLPQMHEIFVWGANNVANSEIQITITARCPQMAWCWCWGVTACRFCAWITLVAILKNKFEYYSSDLDRVWAPNRCWVVLWFTADDLNVSSELCVKTGNVLVTSRGIYLQNLISSDDNNVLYHKNFGRYVVLAGITLSGSYWRGKTGKE